MNFKADDTQYENIRNGNKGAFESLVRAYNKALTAFVFRLIGDRVMAEDIVQDVFVNIWGNRSKIEFGRSLGNLLYLSARNFSYNYLESQKRHRNHLQRLGDFEESVKVYMVEEEAARLLSEAIAQLPQRSAEVIRLSMEGLKQEEIAQKMNVTVANVKLLKSRGIKKLRDIMGTTYGNVSDKGMALQSADTHYQQQKFQIIEDDFRVVFVIFAPFKRLKISCNYWKRDFMYQIRAREK